MIIGEFEVVDHAAVKARMSLFFSLGKVPLRNDNACIASQNQTIYIIHSDELSNPGFSTDAPIDMSVP